MQHADGGPRGAALGVTESLTCDEPAHGRPEFHEMRARTILNRVPEPLPFRWSANPYRGCQHACVYCYARPSHVAFAFDGGSDFERHIFVKTNAAEVLRRELHRPGWRHEAVNIGSIVDPYQPAEGRYRITRGMLVELARAWTPAHIVTKNSMVLRDIDVLTDVHARAGCAVFMSVTTLDVDLARRMEPGTPPPLKRLAAVERLVRAGIPAGVMAAPLLPGINDRPETLAALASAAAAHGACFFIGGTLHLGTNVEPYFRPFLRRERPDLIPLYRRLYRDGRYMPRAYAARIKEQVRALRETYGLPASPPPPRSAREPAQLALAWEGEDAG